MVTMLTKHFKARARKELSPEVVNAVEVWLHQNEQQLEAVPTMMAQLRRTAAEPR
jgi:hypothetical protein